MRDWLQGNPLGAALLGFSALLLLAALVMGWAWNRPVEATGMSAADQSQAALAMPVVVAGLQPVENYQVITERPVFNQTRRPEADSGDGGEDVVVDAATPTSDPEVRLTGVVITPEMKIVTLTPTGKGEPLIVREGTALEGEQLGWSVSQIDARQVVLDSGDGRTLQLDLAVHDKKIAEPPKPRPDPAMEEPQTTEEAQAAGADGEPMSRAEEIRQRIQERREQLRLEAEANAEEDGDEKAATRASYQDAIRTLMLQNKQQAEEEGNEEEQE